MKKYELIQALIEAGAVSVIRAETKAQGLKIVEAVRAGGITAIEITMPMKLSASSAKRSGRKYCWERVRYSMQKRRVPVSLPARNILLGRLLTKAAPAFAIGMQRRTFRGL